MEEAYELGSSSCKHKGEVPEEHIYSPLHEKIEAKENKCRCSKMCAQIVFIVTIFTSLALVISVCLIFHIRDSERMDKIEADIAEEKDNRKSFAAEVIDNSSNLIKKKLKEYASKVNEQFSFLLQKVGKNWFCNDKSCYYFGFEKLNWSKAQESCRQLAANLIEIDSPTENEFVLSHHQDKLCYRQSSTYRGTESEIFDGTPCQRWDSQILHDHGKDEPVYKFTENDISDAENLCRDPSGKGKPWCFSLNPNKIWDFCNVPKCAESFWIGANDLQKEGAWIWAESKLPLSTSSYTNWANGEPNNFDNCDQGENCAVLNTLNGK